VVSKLPYSKSITNNSKPQCLHVRSDSERGFQTSDSWIQTVIRIVTKIELIGAWAMPYASKKFRQYPFTTFHLSDGQTNRQTNRKNQKHHLLQRR